MENVPAMSGINERAAARIMKDVLGEASCKTDVLANIVPQLRNGNGAEALKDKNCEPAKKNEPEPEPEKTGGCTARCTASAEPPGHYHERNRWVFC